MMEIFYDIHGYEGLYQVSNLGNVKSLRNNKILKSRKNRYGYLYVVFSVNMARKTFSVHGLVAKVFIENKENKLEVNHKNGIKTDNRVENLEWCTLQENHRHARDNGLTIAGEKNGSSKLKWEEVEQIRREYIKGSAVTGTYGLAKKYNVSQYCIYRIVIGKNWIERTKNV